MEHFQLPNLKAILYFECYIYYKKTILLKYRYINLKLVEIIVFYQLLSVMEIKAHRVNCNRLHIKWE